MLAATHVCMQPRSSSCGVLRSRVTVLSSCCNIACKVPFVSKYRQHGRSKSNINVFDKLRELFGADKARAIELEGDEDAGDMARIDVSNREGLGGSSPDAFGPLAVLLVGYMEDELAAMRQLLIDMDAEMVKVVPCTTSMLAGTLGQALEASAAVYEQPPLGARRAVVMSGMYGSEVVEVISAYKEAGFPPCVFAGAVPNNYNRNLAELLREVQGEHDAMMRQSEK